MKIQFPAYTLACAAVLFTVTASAASFENDSLRLRLKPRTPQQMAAFYEARGFPRTMINKLNEVCFFTIGIKNKSQAVLWHDLAGWQFTSAGKIVHRYDRRYWKKLWQDMNIPMSSQSTFRWTLLPEQLDFRPQESEGGNITLPRRSEAYDIEAIFYTSPDKTGQHLYVKLTGIQCGEDARADSK